MLIIKEGAVVGQPTNIKKYGDKIRMEVILQTASELNKNRRFYPKNVLEESIQKVIPRVQEGTFVGELDHPIDTNPARQVTVWYKTSSHKFNEIGWDGNKLVGTIETLAATENGRILRDLVIKDNIPVGFSYRGMGDLRQVNEGSANSYYEVVGPLVTVTWDSVSNPSHATAKLIRVCESDFEQIKKDAVQFLGESTFYESTEGLICTSEGICYLPNTFDRLVEKRVLQIREKFKF